MELTEKLKERFCKDNNLNIKIFEEPYFTERIKLYDNKFNTIEKLNLFKQEIEEFDNEQEYFTYYNNVKDQVINFIKSTPEYQNFITEDFNKYKVNNYNIPSSNIFHENNNNKSFISVDLKKGCYSALRFYDKNLVNNTNSYEDFIGKFTNKKHIINSKYIRQVIFGNCNPRRQTSIEKYMMGLMMDNLQKLNLNFVGYTDDEIVIEYDDKAKQNFEKIKNIVYETTKNNDFDVHFDVFKIERQKESDVYIKHFYDNKEPEIKCANHLVMPFILRELNNEKYQFIDFAYKEQGQIAFLTEIKELGIKNEPLLDMAKLYCNTRETKDLEQDAR